MGLIRLISYALLIWVVWQMIKNYLAKQQLSKTRATKAEKHIAQKVVKCRFCDLHLPEEEAVIGASGTFCSESHKQAWLDSNS